ncbi:MAG: phage virion morphogenesis protein [Flavobacteriales bacterium]
MDFNKKLDRLQKTLNRLPPRMAVVAVNFSKERFVRKNWISNKREPWTKRQRKTRGSLMTQSGRLKRSIRKISVSKNHILIGTDVPYAQLHNEGGVLNQTVNVKSHTRKKTRARITQNIRTRKKRTLKGRITTGETKVKAHTRNMNTTIPQRQFMGESPILQRRLEQLAIKELKEALKHI